MSTQHEPCPYPDEVIELVVWLSRWVERVERKRDEQEQIAS